MGAGRPTWSSWGGARLPCQGQGWSACQPHPTLYSWLLPDTSCFSFFTQVIPQMQFNAYTSRTDLVLNAAGSCSIQLLILPLLTPA